MVAVRRAAPVLALIGVTAVWGWTFVVVRDAVGAYPVLPFLAVRFAIAAAILAPAGLRGGSGFKAGLLPGVVLAAGYLAQTAGLTRTTASKAGLLTGLFVVLTPLFAFAVWRARPRLLTLAAVLAAVAGTALLVIPGSSGHGSQEAVGDALEILTAACFAVHILLLSRIAPGKDALRMALAQMSIAAMIFTGGASLTGGFPRPSASVWLALGITGVLASAIAFWLQTAVQQRVSATRTAVILAAEPAFATFFGLVLAGDHFGLAQAAGAAIILTAIAVHEGLPGLLDQSAVTSPAPHAADRRRA